MTLSRDRETIHSQGTRRRWAMLAQISLLLIGGIASFVLVSCGERTTDMDIQMFRASTVDEEVLIRGREAYMRYCVGCHGENGDGQGLAAEFLNPKPRDFTKGTYKFASVAAGNLVRDEDLLRTLDAGLPGSSMPQWNLLDDASKQALVSYIKAFSPKYASGQEGQPLPVTSDPYHNNSAAGIQRGRTVYHGLAGCYKCHPAYVSHEDISAATVSMEMPEIAAFPDDLYQEKMKSSELWGYDIRPPDFTRRRLKNGNSLEDLYRVIQSGVGGTAMPTWSGILEPADLWAMAHYVKSLNDLRGTPEGEQLREQLGIR